MGHFIPVDPFKWAEMVKAQSDIVRYKEMCDELDAECTRLKDENARLRSFCTRTIIPNIDLEKEVTRLKAEVERLKNNCEYLDTKLDEELDKSAMLCGQVERLTKAGDLMAGVIGLPVNSVQSSALIQNWLAAKEGKGQP